MTAPATLYGLLAEFATAEEVTAAARSARAQGYRRIDAYSPFPVQGLAEAIGFRPRLLPYAAFGGGFFGACGGYFMQYYSAVHHYPLLIAGRPLHSWPSFIPLTFELAILGAALSTLLALMLGNRLPEPHHPLFNVDRFERASQDRFFLCIEARDQQFDAQATREFLAALHPAAIHEVNDGNE